MSLWFDIFSFLTTLVLPMAAGWILVHRFGVRQSALDRLMPVGLLAAVPVLTLLTFWGMALDPRLAWLPVLGVVMLVIPALAGAVAVRAKSEYDALDRGTYVVASMLSNRGIVGGLTAFILFGEEGYAWSQMVVVFGPVVLFMVGFPLAGWYRRQHTGELGHRGSFLSLIFSRNQVPLLGIITGLALNLVGISRPEPVGTAVPVVVFVMAWLFLMPTGASLNFAEMWRYGRSLLDMLAIKFLLTPALMAALAWAVGLRGELFAAIVVLAASPTAIFTVILARLQGLNLHLAMASYVLTHLVYLAVVLPVVLAIAAIMRPP